MIVIDGVDTWVKTLSADLAPVIQAGLIGVAKATEGFIAPYPTAHAHGNPWYERGYGPKYRRKNGRITGRKTSEMLGRRWQVASAGRMRVALTNSASYAESVHSSDDQARVHANTGWKTDTDARDWIESRSLAEELIGTAIRRRLQG